MASAALLLALQNRQFQSGITIRASSRNAPTGNAGNSEGRPKVGIPTDDWRRISLAWCRQTPRIYGKRKNRKLTSLVSWQHTHWPSAFLLLTQQVGQSQWPEGNEGETEDSCDVLAVHPFLRSSMTFMIMDLQEQCSFIVKKSMAYPCHFFSVVRQHYVRSAAMRLYNKFHSNPTLTDERRTSRDCSWAALLPPAWRTPYPWGRVLGGVAAGDAVHHTRPFPPEVARPPSPVAAPHTRPRLRPEHR